MLIIVEGPDCAGKSTLVERLRDRIERREGHSVTVIKKGPPTQHPLDEYVMPLVDYRPEPFEATQRHVICDRYHWGERVYPHLWKRTSQMDDPVWWYTELFMRSRGATVVFPTRPAEAHRRCLDERGDDHGVRSSDLPQLNSLYGRVRAESLLFYTSGDVGDDGALDRIVSHQVSVDQVTCALNPFVTYVGSRYVKTLLVGDVRRQRLALRADGNGHRLGQPSGPGFMPYPATSGHYLLRALLVTNWDLNDVGIVNACDVDDVRDVIKTVNPEGVVALGRNAHLRLRDYDVEHGLVPHPQFWRRFHHRRVRAYGELIRRASSTGEDLLSWRS